jgi:poly(3-hydroxybutyrate) depolymerase
VRAQAVVAGGEPPDQPACNGPVAAIFIHDTNDDADIISGNLSALARVGRMNGCDTNYDPTTAVTTTQPLNPAFSNQAPWHPENPLLAGCVTFTGCPENYPVVFCTTEGLGHSDQRERATAAFTLFFDALEPETPPTE